MTAHDHGPELRDEGTIRAYLEELARLKVPVQLWLPVAGALAFETSLEQVGRDAFSTTTTPALEPGRTLRMAFMLDARRFTALTRAEGTGVFRMPASIAHGERRAVARAAFGRGDAAEVYAVERLDGTFPGGRTLQGRLLDLSEKGLRLSLDEFDALSGPVMELKPGDRFQGVRVTGLPHMPPIQCPGTLAHITGRAGGMILEGLSETDRKNLERILAPRLPPSFGLGFPDRKARTDPADRPGAPTPTRVKPKPAEVVERPLERPLPEPPPRPATSAAAR
ncbi:MAG: PilZ domain-containing protein, partial [Holophaga sp.]|nr:PilZ domain-containing protein [Holophaga sp.]